VSDTPKASLGLPVRNGAATIARAIESVQAQTYENWELVISDNLSTDGTSEICARYAAADPRVRHVPTWRDLSQNDNFCETFHLSRGTYFRWYGDDDWLETGYLEHTVAALDAAADAVLCTTLQCYHDQSGPWEVVDHISALGGVTSSDPSKRLRQLLRLFETGDLRGIDPVYSLVRRDVMTTTVLMAPYRFGDFMFSCEIALNGPFVHVPEMLAHRQLAEQFSNRVALKRFTSTSGLANLVQREISLIKVWQRSRPTLTAREQARIVSLLAAFGAREHLHGVRRRAKRLFKH
jgi:glycosyltransferase involved in cell wall biosynthesis